MSKDWKVFILFLVLLLAAGLPFAYSQDDGCWGSDKPCSDGKFRDYQGKEQPTACDNQPNGPNKDKKDTMHDCMCARAGDPSTPCAAGQQEMPMPGSQCKTYCREHACGCANPCNT
jgi:hypothetical protein